MQVLILSFEQLKVLQSFFVGVLNFEELRAEAAGLLLGSLQLSLAFLILLFCLGQNLNADRVMILKAPLVCFS